MKTTILCSAILHPQEEVRLNEPHCENLFATLRIMQSDQHLCCLLSGKYNFIFLIPKFQVLDPARYCN